MNNLPDTYKRNTEARRQLELDIKEAELNYSEVLASCAPQWEVDDAYDRYMQLWKRLNG